MSHIDLFTGLAGFSLACHWNGIQTEVMCEKDERCRRFLERTWPGIPIINDIRDFDGSEWRGRFLLTAGVPCQPASRAGKQRGKEDDRWLWPEALRIVSEARPDWVLFENPPGIDDVGLGGILADLEAQGYETAPPLIIPACAVNSPQLRQRVWIVAHASKPGIGDNREASSDERGGTLDTRAEGLRQGNGEALRNGVASTSQGDMAHSLSRGQETIGWTESNRGISKRESDNLATKAPESSQGDLADTETTSRLGLQDRKKSEPFTQDGRCYTDFWGTYVWLPCADGKVRRAPDDTFGLVDGLHRSLLAALGNSIVPQVAYEIIKVIKEIGEG